jgi:ankyrin repeat protein
MAASCHGHNDIVQQLLEAGADVNAQENYSNTLWEVSEGEHGNIFQQLLEAGAEAGADRRAAVIATHYRPPRQEDTTHFSNGYSRPERAPTRKRARTAMRYRQPR